MGNPFRITPILLQKKKIEALSGFLGLQTWRQLITVLTLLYLKNASLKDCGIQNGN